MQKVNGLHSAAPTSGMPNLNMFHPVDFVIPVGPIFAYVFGMCFLTFHLEFDSLRVNSYPWFSQKPKDYA